MSSFASQVFKLASDAAHLARMISQPHDVLGDVLRQLQAANIGVTHCGHAAFRAAEVGFSGADGFQVEDALVRVSDTTIAIEPDHKLRWFALSVYLPLGRDAIVTADITTDPASSVAAFIRYRQSGKHVDSARVLLGAGHVVADHYVHHPDLAGDEGQSSQLFIIVDSFARATIARLGIVTVPSST